MVLLDDDGIATALESVPAWRREGDSITRTIEASSFLEGLDLVGAVGRAAEEADHHPDIDIRWRRITFVLSTHSAGGLTEQDFELARAIDRLAP
ncbi:MAG TPA: 4a-hydroxytetrahydrobiopterin dehydratase [Marmoricola sp.]|jgi:4a-hydroxytetrahydrobiopterin dehydratase|nr:4a-hydroxytetrahydrobiopterin dehydratase [Marmoricola sp.]